MADSLDNVLSEQGKTQTEQVQTEQVQTEQIAETTGEQAATPAETQDDPLEKHRKGLEAAAAAERRKRQEAEQREAAANAKLEQLLRQQQPKPAEEGAPDPNDYQDNPQEYWRLLARYEARQELRAEQVRLKQEQERQQAQSRQAQFQEAASKAVMAGQAEFQDFDTVVNSGLAPFMTPVMQQALVLTQGGHKIAYHLGKNPLEAARIAQLDPMSMLIELGELRTKVTNPTRQPIPQTLTQTRDARGQFKPADDGPPSLEAILGRK